MSAAEATTAPVVESAHSDPARREDPPRLAAATSRVAPPETTRADPDERVTVDGVVVDERGHAISNADLWLTRFDPPFQGRVVTRTDSDGRYHVASAPLAGRCYLGARKSGFIPSPLFAVGRDAGEETSMHATLVLQAGGGSVSGRVIDAAGVQIAGASVLLGSDHLFLLDRATDRSSGHETIRRISRFETTDEEGRFAVDGLEPGAVSVLVKAAGFAPWFGEARVVTATECRISVTMERGGVLEGVIRDATGAPVAGVEIDVGSPMLLRSSHGSTDADGRFRLDGLSIGRIEVHAIAPDRSRAHAVLETRREGPTQWGAQLEAGGSIVGSIRDAAGEPVPNCGVFVRGRTSDPLEPELLESRFSDGTGRFTVDHLPDTVYEVSFRDQRGRDVPAAFRQGVATNGPALEIVLPADVAEDAFINAVVLDDADRPVGNASVYIGNRGPGSMGSQVHHVDANTGVLHAGPLAPGTYWVMVHAPGMTDLTVHDFIVKSGGVTDLGTLRFPRRAALRVRLSREDDGDLDGVTVSVSGAGGFRATAPPVDGIALFSSFGPGRYAVRINGPETAARLLDVEIKEGRDEVVEVALEAGVPVVLRFRFPDRPRDASIVPNAGVKSAGTKQWLALTPLEDHGSSSFDWRVCLAPGDYVVPVLGFTKTSFEQSITIKATDPAERVIEIRLP